MGQAQTTTYLYKYNNSRQIKILSVDEKKPMLYK